MTASVALSLRPAILTAERMTFSEAVREHQDEVYGVALRITGNRDAALDVTSATFLKAYRAFDRYDPSRPIRYWLLRIATNEAISHARRTTRELRHHAGVESARELAARDDAPDEATVAREERERIRSAVAALPDLYRVVVVLRYFNELSVGEIATITGRPASTVGVQLLRGRALLRQSLQGIS